MQTTLNIIIVAAIMFAAGYLLARHIWKENWKDMCKLYDNAVQRSSELKAEMYQKELERDALKQEYFRRGFEEGSNVDTLDEVISSVMKKMSLYPIVPCGVSNEPTGVANITGLESAEKEAYGEMWVE